MDECVLNQGECLLAGQCDLSSHYEKDLCLDSEDCRCCLPLDS